MGNLPGVLLEPAKTVVSQIGTFLGNLLLALIILFIGWLISKLIKVVVTKGLKAIKIVEYISSTTGLDDVLAKGGIAYSLSELIGVICYWLALLVTFVVALYTVGLTFASKILDGIVGYVPNIIAAIFILVLGMFIARLLSNIVKTTASNIGVPQVNLLSKIVEVAVIIFAIAITLEQLNIGADVIKLTISILLGSLGLGLALAFGLGCRDIAAKYMAELIDKLKTKK